MAWVDLDYYKNEYLMGRTPSIPDSDFAFFERNAEIRINRKNVSVENPQECLKMCVCEVAELLHKNASDKEVRSVVKTYLSWTEYHQDFVYAGL